MSFATKHGKTSWNDLLAQTDAGNFIRRVSTAAGPLEGLKILEKAQHVAGLVALKRALHDPNIDIDGAGAELARQIFEGYAKLGEKPDEQLLDKVDKMTKDFITAVELSVNRSPAASALFGNMN